ncbi:hypothetical protein JAAARDRAFT_128374 [Jaapia argillacea MUCL 33604]|uniref:Het-C-domain-containing protein n=1 Tax=Jaapia argillacea MUCL 33604 TaxID=933084 RepID=A0A067Q5I4_9AGAM|nr:hypothetical protein JAAARDRAFT_128374 [Jaapia argillacea MUCL 33604]
MNRNTKFLLLFLLLFICLSSNGVYAFGAGNIPGFAYMEGKAFRHGDIEDVIGTMVKRGAGGGGMAAIGSLLGNKGSKFTGLDVKRVYFGNWLRDYSQAVDIAGLKKLQLQTIINLCIALGFLAHGYATHEFEVTIERLGVYLPTEHIDNPKGYGAGEDARRYDQRLRGPVDVRTFDFGFGCFSWRPRELEVDMRTGMKNYIANENGHWDTSKALVRRTLEHCIHLGRTNRAQGRKQDEYEAFRLLGQLLHTLEDFPAHSNFCELALVSLGYHDVFVHVGDHVRIQAPNGRSVAPLVTGTFGSSDFIHSLLGEATDHIASVSDLNRELDKARVKSRSGGPGGGSGNPADTLRDLLFTLPGVDGGQMSRELESVERIRAGATAPGGKRPEDMSPQELHAVLWQVLTFRDSVVKKIEITIEKVPGLSALVEKLMESIQVFVFTVLEPFLKPIMKVATEGLQSASGEVINNVDQYEVFNDPRASDPTHSFLSKDHFNLILNEPAGRLAKLIVGYTVNLVIRAWDDASMNVRQLTEEVLQCMFHPDFHNSNSTIQRQMLQFMRDWMSGHGNQQHEIIRRLSKNAVRNHENMRLTDSGKPPAQGSVGWNAGQAAQAQLGGFVQGIPGVGQAQSLIGMLGGSGARREVSDPPGYPGAPGAHQHQHGPPGQGGYGGGYASDPPPPTTGQAASYYSPGQSPAPPSTGGTYPGSPSSYAAPPGAPSNASTYPGSPSSFAPPAGSPVSFPGIPNEPEYGGYNPNPSYPPPSSGPSFPGAGGYGGYDAGGGYGGGGGGYGAPPGPPPPGGGFPSADPWAQGHQSPPPQFPSGGVFPAPGGGYGGPPPPPGPPYGYSGPPTGW